MTEFFPICFSLSVGILYNQFRESPTNEVGTPEEVSKCGWKSRADAKLPSLKVYYMFP